MPPNAPITPDPLAPLRTYQPPVHPRDVQCRQAADELHQFLEVWAKRYALTAAEAAVIFGSLTHRQALQCVLSERGPK